jgi:hypothetical protein
MQKFQELKLNFSYRKSKDERAIIKSKLRVRRNEFKCIGFNKIAQFIKKLIGGLKKKDRGL